MAEVLVTPKEIQQAERYDRLSKLYAKRAAPIKDRIKAAFAVGAYVIEGVSIKRTESRVLDSAKFMAKFPPEKFPQYYRTVLNPEAIPPVLRKGMEKRQQAVSLDRVTIVSTGDDGRDA